MDRQKTSPWEKVKNNLFNIIYLIILIALLAIIFNKDNTSSSIILTKVHNEK